MKIWFLSYRYWPPDFGGELLISIERFRTLGEKGHEITVLTSGKPGFPKRETVNGLRILRSPVIHDSRFGRLLRRIVFFLWALRYLATSEYDIVHFGSLPGINRATSALSGYLLTKVAHKKKAGTVLVYSLFDTGQEAVALQGIQGKLREKFLTTLDCVVGVSTAIYESLAKICPTKAALIFCGVQDELFRPIDPEERLRVRQEVKIPPGDVVFVFLGSIGHRKGFDVLANAFAKLSQKHPHWKLLVIGPRNSSENQNIDPQEVDTVMRPLKGNKQVIFLGRVNDRTRLAQLLGTADVFVFPSRREGMGIAPMEAMATGTPPIIARIPGVTDLASIDNVTGLYITPGNQAELEQAMEKLGSDPELRRQMGANARRQIVNNFGWQKHIEEWEQVYSDICSR